MSRAAAAEANPTRCVPSRPTLTLSNNNDAGLTSLSNPYSNTTKPARPTSTRCSVDTRSTPEPVSPR
ncbi:unnamed protein product [Leptosia nina]|uniref:Uncharacterized protein n=1 Tax=Leptosia nina TaxID=320188 RepID=A0AAV1JZQ1_9NEOP